MKRLIYVLIPLFTSGCITHELMNNLNDVHANTSIVAQEDDIEHMVQSANARQLQLIGQENTYTFNLSRPVADDFSMFLETIIDQLSFSIEATPDSYHAHEGTIYRPDGFDGQLHICYDPGHSDSALTLVEREMVAHLELSTASYYCGYRGYEKLLDIRQSSIVANPTLPEPSPAPTDMPATSSGPSSAKNGASSSSSAAKAAADQDAARRRIHWQQARKNTGINPDVMFIPLAVATDVLTMPIQLIGKGISFWLPDDSTSSPAPAVQIPLAPPPAAQR